VRVSSLVKSRDPQQTTNNAPGNASGIPESDSPPSPLKPRSFVAAIDAFERGGRKGQTRLKSGEERREAAITFGYVLTYE
jgi:hypothetical protein